MAHEYNEWICGKFLFFSISQGDLVVYDEDDEKIDFETLNI